MPPCPLGPLSLLLQIFTGALIYMTGFERPSFAFVASLYAPGLSGWEKSSSLSLLLHVSSFSTVYDSNLVSDPFLPDSNGHCHLAARPHRWQAQTADVKSSPYLHSLLNRLEDNHSSTLTTSSTAPAPPQQQQVIMSCWVACARGTTLLQSEAFLGPGLVGSIGAIILA